MAAQAPVAALTSRISVQKLRNTFSQFGEFKKHLVGDIGFQGILCLRPLPKLNLRFSASLMERVNPEKKEITLDDGETALQIHPKDVGNVFGLPCGTRRITSSSFPSSDSVACAEYKKFAEGMSDKGAHSLKAAEAVLLLKDLNESSSKLDIDMFKIALVIFVMGHLLSPSSKHDYTTVDYWEALADTAEINQFNWCELVINHLAAAVRKMISDLQTKHSTAIHLLGCHLFLQVCMHSSI